MGFPVASREEAIKEAFRDPDCATIVVHRAVQGRHVETTACWCEPVVLQARLTVGQVLADLKRIERLH